MKKIIYFILFVVLIKSLYAYELNKTSGDSRFSINTETFSEVAKQEYSRLKNIEQEAFSKRNNFEIFFNGKKIIEKNKKTKEEKQISSFIVSPGKKYIIYFEKIYTYTLPQEDTNNKHTFFYTKFFRNYAKYKVYLFKKNSRKIIISFYYNNVYNNGVSIEDKLSWSPNDSYFILSPEGWSGGSGNPGYSYIVKCKTGQIYTIYQTNYFWVDNHTIAYTAFTNLMIGFMSHVGIKNLKKDKEVEIGKSQFNYLYSVEGLTKNKKLIIECKYGNLINEEKATQLSKSEPDKIGRFMIDLTGKILKKIE